MREMFEPDDDVRPIVTVGAVAYHQYLVEGRDQLPHVARDEEPDYEDADSG